MVFSSQIFIFIFLPFTLLSYYLFPNKLRNYVLLLLLSIFFYSWGGVNYVLILLTSILINYSFGIFISKYIERIAIKRLLLTIGVILNLILLFYFKYYDFTITNLNTLFKLDIALKEIVLPIGISFFTFQGMSYIIDIYRGTATVNKNIFSVALYISLFPQLVAGPIVKYKDIEDQIRNRKETLQGFSYGIERFIIGLAKKVIIADVLASIAVSIIPNSTNVIDTPTAWLGIICYTLQIYFDFSGYSDMAIGLGAMFGFTFMENFNFPYISKSITEFWRRWHISLSTWFKEYLYIPLGGNRTGNTYVNLLIVFFVTGLWHGSSWNFIIWGLWHGLFIIIEKFIQNKNWYIKTPSIIKWFVTIFIVIIGWVFFSFDSLSNAFNFLSVMFGITHNEIITFEISYYLNFRTVIWLIFAIILSTPVLTNIFKKYNSSKYFEIIKTIALSILLVICIIFIVNSTYSPFIYFQF